jgi:hypothetical protein
VPSEKGGNPHPRTLASTAKQQGTGESIAPSSTLLSNQAAQDQPVNDKYQEFDLLLYESQCISENSNHHIISEHQVYLHNLESSISSNGVKHRLRKAVQFWKDIQAFEFIISIISTGYVISPLPVKPGGDYRFTLRLSVCLSVCPRLSVILSHLVFHTFFLYAFEN